MLSKELMTQIRDECQEFWDNEVGKDYFRALTQGKEIGHRTADLVDDETTALLTLTQPASWVELCCDDGRLFEGNNFGIGESRHGVSGSPPVCLMRMRREIVTDQQRDFNKVFDYTAHGAAPGR